MKKIMENIFRNVRLTSESYLLQQKHDNNNNNCYRSVTHPLLVQKVDGFYNRVHNLRRLALAERVRVYYLIQELPSLHQLQDYVHLQVNTSYFNVIV